MGGYEACNGADRCFDRFSANGVAIRAVIVQAAAQGARLAGFARALFPAIRNFRSAVRPNGKGWRGCTGSRTSLHRGPCGELGIFAVVGGAHRLPHGRPPHNSLYIFSGPGALLTRYDKRFLSNSELGGWYTPRAAPIVVEVNGFRFGCAICIESQFPEIFSDYERMGIDGLIFASYGLPPHFQIALRAHAGLNCLWFAAATPAH